MPNQENIAPHDPGEILEADFLKAYGLTQNEVAMDEESLETVNPYGP